MAAQQGLLQQGAYLEGVTGKQSACFQGNTCRLQAMSHCLQAADSVDGTSSLKIVTDQVACSTMNR